MADEMEDPQFWLPSHFLDDEDDHPPPISPNYDEEEEEEEEEEGCHHGGHTNASMALSPPSTLYGMRSWSTSSRESFSASSSPPSSIGKDDPWDLTKLLDDQPEPRHLKRNPDQEKGKKRAWGGGRSTVAASTAAAAAAALPLGQSAAAWPPLRPPPKTEPNTGMRAVFLQRGGPKEPSGTGVFHPRSTNVDYEPACTSVLLPAKVVHALKGHGRSGLNPDSIFIHNVALLQRRGLLPHLSPSQPSTQEPVMGDQKIGLPSEWTY